MCTPGAVGLPPSAKGATGSASLGITLIQTSPQLKSVRADGGWGMQLC